MVSFVIYKYNFCTSCTHGGKPRFSKDGMTKIWRNKHFRDKGFNTLISTAHISTARDVGMLLVNPRRQRNGGMNGKLL
jgi:hypothetical protein